CGAPEAGHCCESDAGCWLRHLLSTRRGAQRGCLGQEPARRVQGGQDRQGPDRRRPRVPEGAREGDQVGAVKTEGTPAAGRPLPVVQPLPPVLESSPNENDRGRPWHRTGSRRTSGHTRTGARAKGSGSTGTGSPSFGAPSRPGGRVLSPTPR